MLGLTPSHDGEGVLQDVHWSAGLFGYFPTYALGNLYGLCFWERLREDLPGVQADIARGNFGALKAWLSAKIWSQGARLLPAELLLAATGSTLSPEPFVSYLEEKYGALYNL
jgi:carboxypeptidase Taq